MFGKLESFKYSNIDLLESDFNVMVENCLSYNERDTIFFRCGVTMRDKGGAIIRQAKREIDSIGFDPDSGNTLEYLISIGYGINILGGKFVKINKLMV